MTQDITSGQRIIIDGSRFDKFFRRPEFKDTIKKKNGIVHETVVLMKRVVWTYKGDTEKIAAVFRRPTVRQTCEAIWHFLFYHIQYKLDEKGIEQLRTPARSWAERKTGIDCDCFSIFASSILTNLNIPHTFRITKYKEDNWQHVYVIVPLPTGNYYTIDAVLGKADYEKPYSQKMDYPMSLNGIDIAVLSGVEDNNPDQSIGALLAAEQQLNGDYNELAGVGTHEWHNRLYNYLVATKQAAVANPLLLAAAGENPQDFIDMVDYAITHWHSPLRDHALHHLATEEQRINRLNGFDYLSGDDDLNGDDDLLGADDVINGLGRTKKKRKGRFFKGIKNAVKKVGHFIARTNPLTIAVRNGILLAMKLNFRKMASRLKWGYATQQQAQAKGVSVLRWQKARKSVEEVGKFFEKLGGKKQNLQKAVLRGKAGGLSGEMPIDGLGSLGEPATAATIATALAAIANIFRIMAKHGLAKKEEGDAGNLKAGLDNGDSDSEGAENNGDSDQAAPEAAAEEVNGLMGTAAPYAELLGHIASVAADEQSLSGISDREMDAKLYTMLVHTRSAAAANPAIIATMREDPALFINMLDYAIAHWHTPMRDQALHVLASNEQHINRLNGFDDSLLGDYELSGDDLFGGLGRTKKKKGKKKKNFFTKLQQAHRDKKAAKLAKHNVAVAAARNGFLLALKTDAGMLASRLKWGYATAQQAVTAGVPESFRLRAQKAIRRVEHLYSRQGGTTSDLRDAILSGQAGNLSGVLEPDAHDLGYLGYMLGKSPKSKKHKAVSHVKHSRKKKAYQPGSSLPMRLRAQPGTKEAELKFRERFATGLHLTYAVATAALPLLHATITALLREGIIAKADARSLKNNIVAEVTQNAAAPEPGTPVAQDGSSIVAMDIPQSSGNARQYSGGGGSNYMDSSQQNSDTEAAPAQDDAATAENTPNKAQQVIETVNDAANDYDAIKDQQEKQDQEDKAEKPDDGTTTPVEADDKNNEAKPGGIMDFITNNPGVAVVVGGVSAFLLYQAMSHSSKTQNEHNKPSKSLNGTGKKSKKKELPPVFRLN